MRATLVAALAPSVTDVFVCAMATPRARMSRARAPVSRASVTEIRGQPAWRHRRAAQDRERAHEHLDAGRLQILAQLAVHREDDERPVARRVQPGREQRELAVGAVAPRRGVQVQDGPRQLRALP